MIKISRRTDYAVRVLISLAKHADEGPRSVQMIVEEMLIPLTFVKRIVADLVRAGLINSQRGSKGGLWLARPADEITLLDVVEACDEPITVSQCIDDPDFCPLSADCPVRRRWARLRALLHKELQRTTIAQLAKESTKSDAQNTLAAFSMADSVG
ncbi:MAG: Rrf2 family transcriptional regulator [Chloroflexi bacterium]|nr:Rrf2 family transcriptional regulator [Chloroflexota bacterium]